MANKLLIDRKQRNLLLFSNFIRNSEEDIFEILQNNLSVSNKLAKENDIENKIKSNLPTWLNFSRKEWKSHDKNPFLINGSDSTQRCELCNSPLKWRYEIFNETSNRKLSIGGECVKQFKQLAGLGKLVTTDEEYKRYNELISKYPQTLDVFLKNIGLLDRTEIVVPIYYQESYKKTEKEITKLLRNYIKRNMKLNNSTVEKTFRKYSTSIESIQKFVDENRGNRNYLSRVIVDSLRRNQISDSSMIISTVEGNNGVIPNQLSPKIKVSDYLKLYEKDINLKFSRSNVSLSEINQSAYVIQVEKNNTKYKFKVDSEYLLTKHHEKMKFIFPENFKNDIDMFDINDTQTKDRLFLNGQKYLLTEKNADLKDINIGRIVSMYDNDLTSEEYSEAQQKVIRIISNLLVLSKSNTKNLEIFVNKDVVNIGKLVLFHNESSIEYESTNMSEKDFYEYIVSQLI